MQKQQTLGTETVFKV